MIYAQIAEAVRTAGGITVVGVAENAGETAVLYSGTNIIRKYMDGERIAEILFNITGADTADHQKQLVDRLCGVLDDICSAALTVEGVQIMAVNVTALPAPTVFSGEYWIYSAGLKVVCRYNDKRRNTNEA